VQMARYLEEPDRALGRSVGAGGESAFAGSGEVERYSDQLVKLRRAIAAERRLCQLSATMPSVCTDGSLHTADCLRFHDAIEYEIMPEYCASFKRVAVGQLKLR